MKTILLIDATNLAHKALHVYDELSAEVMIGGRLRKVNTGLGFGVLKQLLQLQEKFSPDKIEVVWDGGCWRKREIYDQYKLDRKPRTDKGGAVVDIRNEIKFCIKLLKRLAIPQMQKDGEESDDIIASIDSRYNAGGWRVVIASPDSDMKQLVKPGTKLWRALPKGAKRY